MKKVLIASDSFKGTLSSKDIAGIAKSLVRKKYRESIILDAQILGDGGEGTLEAVASIKGGTPLKVDSFDAEGRPTKAPLLLFDDGRSAFVEAASIIGLPLIQGSVDPLDRTTRGLGILIKEAHRRGARKVYIGLGGSSTNELGTGMLQEMGVNFCLGRTVGIKDALNIKKLKIDAFKANLSGAEFICLGDVNNPLLGQTGATYVYGPQKGYGGCLPYLEERMTHLGRLFEKELGVDFIDSPGAGAAGGLGGAFISFFNAKMESGAKTLLSWSKMEQRVDQADLVITGEGRFDEQSLNGKLLSGILGLCPKEKLALIVGQCAYRDSGLRVYQTATPGEKSEEIRLHAKREYEDALDRVLSEAIKRSQ